MNGAIIVYNDDSVEMIQSLLDLCGTISECVDLLVLGDDGDFQESGFSVTGKFRHIHWFKGRQSASNGILHLTPTSWPNL